MSAPQRYLAVRFVVLFLLALSLVDLLAMLVIVGFHAYSPASIQTTVLAPMTYILAGASGTSLVAGLVYSLLRYPAQRNTVLLLTLIVLGLLGAHLYTINTPSLTADGAVSGPFTSGGESPNLGDNNITIAPSASASSPAFLDLTITDGGNPLASVSVKLNGAPLSLVSLSPAFSETAPLTTGQTAKAVLALSGNLTQGKLNELSVSYQYLSCYDTTKQVDGCVMDEVYYVPAAQTMLSGEKCAPYADNCNLEHPYLSKAFIAAGIAVFGNDTFGWRIFNVILGTFSIPVLFGVCWAITKNERLSLYAAFLLAFETLFFVHSSIAVIDVGAIFFSLLGFLFYFTKAHWWKFDTVILTASAFALAALSKETAIFLLIVLVLYHLLFAEGGKVRRVLTTVELLLTVFLVFAVGLQIYDSLFGAGTATTFLGQVEFILKYGASLTMTPSSQGWIDTVLKTPIRPWNWVTYYSPVGYLVTSVKVTSGTTSFSYVSIGYYGITNQFEVWLLYIWGGYTGYTWWKTKGKLFSSDADARDFRLARLALVWVSAILIGYLALYFYGRITYPYYFISAVPALAMGGAYLFTRAWFPRPIAYILLAGVFLWFFIYYPDKAFLPTWLRVWLGH